MAIAPPLPIDALMPDAGTLAQFIALWTADAGFDPGGMPEESVLAGAAARHWRLARQRRQGVPQVAVYAPDFDRHGWQSSHTAVQVVAGDMPFLVDSVIMVLQRRGLAVHRRLHPVLSVRRDAEGRARGFGPAGAEGDDESFIHLETDRLPDEAAHQALREELLHVLADLQAAVAGYGAMRQRLREAITDAGNADAADADDAAEMLAWLDDGHFLFMGYVCWCAEPGATRLTRDDTSALGLLRDPAHPRFGHCLDGLPDDVDRLTARPSPLLLVKADARSTLHRPGWLDCVAVTRRDEAGRVCAMHRFVGLYTARVHHGSIGDIPVLRGKLRRIFEQADYPPGGHREKTLADVLETWPREDLLETEAATLARFATEVVALRGRPRTRVLLREPGASRLLQALVFLPRERYDERLRARVLDTLRRALAAETLDASVALGESPLARLHVVARPGPGASRLDVAALERELDRWVRGWDEALRRALDERLGEAAGTAAWHRWQSAVPASLREELPARGAASDLALLDALTVARPLRVKLHAGPPETPELLHLRLLCLHEPPPLGDSLPLLESLGLRALRERSWCLQPAGGHPVHLVDFTVRLPDAAALDAPGVHDALVELAEALFTGRAEADGFNRLLLAAALPMHRILWLRACARWLLQAGLGLSQRTVEQVLATHPVQAADLAALFAARFDPDLSDRAPDCARLEARMREGLRGVAGRDAYRVLACLLDTVLATVRTSAWQVDDMGRSWPFLALKIRPAGLSWLPRPRPMAEIFVHAARFEAVHLRGAPVARGGLRWSDRPDDFRTEVLGLMKAQQVKNAVIVPQGAKGGFVCRRTVAPAARREEGLACYRLFIRALLALTDDLDAGGVCPPARTVRHDGDDPYLVVAADKGTATFSDEANAIATERGFWLGDAFASGGSAGYDHKKLGITARGAWESALGHFAELRLDPRTDPVTVAGIGDMSGDVFGNGLLRSRSLRLVAAFDHRHVFVDPDPDAAASFAERARLFALPASSWADYDARLMSPGGFVVARDAASVRVGPEAARALGIHEGEISPDELVRAVLRAPVDLLYNGGIGTWVKAASETHADASDRANDALRVDAGELRCRVVVEGGNLGFTQRARIEYAAAGGRCFTDAIDNSAGVDCSDHEVNLKIALADAVRAGTLLPDARDALVAELSDEVAARVLRDNRRQTRLLLREAGEAADNLPRHARLIARLEASAGLDRRLEGLPDAQALRDREGRGLTAPELAVLMAHEKLALKRELLASDLPDSEAVRPLLHDYFPPAVEARVPGAVSGHRLAREIAATQLVNALVDRSGLEATWTLSERTHVDGALERGCSIVDAARAWLRAADRLGLWAHWQTLDEIDDPAALAARRHAEGVLGAKATEGAAMLMEGRNGLDGLCPAIDDAMAAAAGKMVDDVNQAPGRA